MTRASACARVLWFEQQTIKRHTKRSVSMMPTDPWFHKQWYMNNNINLHLNILTAWSKGYSGLGVVLTIVDDGIEKDHLDLSASYTPLASYDLNSNDPDPQPRYSTGNENCPSQAPSPLTENSSRTDSAPQAQDSLCWGSGSRSQQLHLHCVTTDLHHCCTNKHTGTSASAPLAAGMIALALEANPVLTWHDLQHLTIRSSKPTHLLAEEWAVNGVGHKVNHQYGYGLLDMGLLVEVAKMWTGTQPQNIGSQLTVSTDISCLGRTKLIHLLEHVQVQLSLSYSRRGDLVMALTSLMRTTSTLCDTSQQGYRDWTFMSTHFWDENPNGTWTLWLENKGNAYNIGLLTSFILHLHGTGEDITAQRSAASAVDDCTRWDAQGTECGSSLYTHQRPCPPCCPLHCYGQTRRTTATHRACACAGCHPSCYTCQGASANTCTSCPPACIGELSHSCSLSQGSLPKPWLPAWGGLLLALACGSLILCLTHHVASCPCWEDSVTPACMHTGHAWDRAALAQLPK
ncbi:LOW QUALITY PROTEIN: proprotein convertase subtilisin/kexin type 4 [Porphyrio hochstetteri]